MSVSKLFRGTRFPCGVLPDTQHTGIRLIRGYVRKGILLRAFFVVVVSSPKVEFDCWTVKTAGDVLLDTYFSY